MRFPQTNLNMIAGLLLAAWLTMRLTVFVGVIGLALLPIVVLVAFTPAASTVARFGFAVAVAWVVASLISFMASLVALPGVVGVGVFAAALVMTSTVVLVAGVSLDLRIGNGRVLLPARVQRP